MMDSHTPRVAQSPRRVLLLLAWLLVLAVSDLPDILMVKLGSPLPVWLIWAKVAVPVVFLILCWIWKLLRPLWQFACVLAAFALMSAVVTWLGSQPAWFDRFYKPGTPYPLYFGGAFILDILFAVVLIAVMWLIKGNRKDFFLVKGQLDAPIEPVRWLGIGSGESWRTFGWIFTGCATLAVILASFIGAQIPAGGWQRAFSLLPFAILFSVINACTEESYFRLPFLSTLPDVVGKNQALLLSSTFFGMAHFLYGSPGGVIGFLMTAFLAWLMGKSILETKGLLWALIIHFFADITIFFSYALYWQ